MKPNVVFGNILDQPVDVIVNSWNRNIIPWWLLIPQGVSGAIKKQAGLQPFVEVGRMGAIPLGEARETSSGKLDYQAIIHVAGINMCWFATEYSVRRSVESAMEIINAKNYKRVAFPLIGSGSGNRGQEWSFNIMLDTFDGIDSDSEVTLVRYKK
ncbi:macro domain-containing protein [Sessilibacter corallicola]|uniref:Macro domain-containing protein n=1 Tax=Sessilibacter corallicola TaxID=2904075 RepID=A0ABQ0AD12_9GAMM